MAVSNIGSVARYGPPDDFHNQPTEHANWGLGEGPPHDEPPPHGEPPPEAPDQAGQPEGPDFFDRDDEPTPWYRRPAMLIGWIVLVLILTGLIAFGIVELIHGDQGTGNAPSTSTTSATSSTETTTTTPTTPTETTTTPTSSSAAAPPPQPTQPHTQQPAQPPPHHHHLPHLPSVITIPEIPTVITLPPGLP